MRKINKTILIILMILLTTVLYLFFTNNITVAPTELPNETNEEVIPEEDVELNSDTEDTYVEPMEKLTDGLPILMYHFFYDANAGETGSDSNWMEISTFEEQMKYLSENGYYYPSWSEVADYVAGDKSLPIRSVVVSIDDGDPSFFSLALPILEKYNVTATSFLITAWYGDAVSKYNSPILNFESHTHDMHIGGTDGKGKILTASYEDALNDLNTSISICGSNNALCYPFGHYNDHAINILKDAGFKVAVTTEGGRAKPGMDPYKLPRIRTSKGMSLNSFIAMVK